MWWKETREWTITFRLGDSGSKGPSMLNASPDERQMKDVCCLVLQTPPFFLFYFSCLFPLPSTTSPFSLFPRQTNINPIHSNRRHSILIISSTMFPSSLTAFSEINLKSQTPCQHLSGKDSSSRSSLAHIVSFLLAGISPNSLFSLHFILLHMKTEGIS